MRRASMSTFRSPSWKRRRGWKLSPASQEPRERLTRASTAEQGQGTAGLAAGSRKFCTARSAVGGAARSGFAEDDPPPPAPRPRGRGEQELLRLLAERPRRLRQRPESPVVAQRRQVRVGVDQVVAEAAAQRPRQQPQGLVLLAQQR